MLVEAGDSLNPGIAIASTIFTEKLGLDNFQETRSEYLFQDCSKYVFMANTPEQARNGLQTAIQHTIIQNVVAVLGLPGDVASADIEKVHLLFTLSQGLFLDGGTGITPFISIFRDLKRRNGLPGNSLV